MNKMVVATTKFVKRNTPTILTALASVGTIGTAVLSARGALKGQNRVTDKQRDLATLYDMEDVEIPFTKMDYIRTAAPSYIPAVIVGVGTIACIVGSNTINRRHQAGLASAYVLLDQAFKDYQKKAAELYGEDTDEKIKDAVTSDHLEEHLKNHPEHDISNLPDGNILCCEESSSDYFFDTTMAQVIDAQYQLNRKFAENGEVVLNDFYELLGIPTRDYGEEIGWEWSAMLDATCFSWIDFENRLARLDNGKEYYIISTKVKPYMIHNPDDKTLPFL